MSSVDLILKTLKRIDYQDVDSLDDSDFNSLSTELKSFFEVFCTLDENNVLTSEEIEAYSALTPSQLEKIDILMKSGLCEKNYTEYEKKRKEAYFLQEQLTHIENHNKALERQIDLFKKHEEGILQEKQNHEKFLMNAKKRFRKFEMTKVPKAEEEFISSLKSSLEVAQDLKSLIMHPDSNHNKLPTSTFVKDLVQQYTDAEEKVLQCINSYVQSNFQIQESGTLSFIDNEMLHSKELEKDATYIMKKLKSSMIDNIMNEIEVFKCKIMVKHLETIDVAVIHCPSSLQGDKLNEAMKLNEQLKKREEEYKKYVCDAISKYVDALVAEMTWCAANEMINNFQLHTKNISLPMNYLLRQRSRCEKLIASLSEHMGNFQNLREIIQKVLKEINEEQLCLQERQNQIGEELIGIAKNQNDQHSDAHVLSSLHEILATSEESKIQEISKLSITDVVQKANKFFEVEEHFKRRHEENMKTVDLIENHAQCLESLLYADKKYSGWHDLEQSLNADLNDLVMKLTSFEGSISECNKDMDQKQKLLEKKRNLYLARHLYVYALIDRELFKRYIDEIKVFIENSTNQ